ncbi:MAG: hypothetical protein H7Y17_03360 [Chlorobia bacterium]|nr:hypothetical protein [Fimbriimonadaceae bacterium]
MRRLSFLALLLAVICPSLSLAQTERFSGTLKVAFGWVLDPDGTKRSIKGLEVPFVAERIDAVRLRREPSGRLQKVPETAFDRLAAGLNPGPLGGGFGPPTPVSALTIYNADSGVYGIIMGEETPSDPSSLDDYGLSSGAGKRWETMTFGVDVPGTNEVVTHRYRCYSTYNSSAPAGTSAFGGEFADWGFHSGEAPIPALPYLLEFPNPGTWKVTIGVTPYNIIAPGNACYMAQQLRHPNGTALLNYADDNGEGAFNTDYRVVYSTAAGPTVGTSTNGFWYDGISLDGMYENGEFDILSDVQFSNHLMTITAEDSGGGTTDTIRPLSYTVVRGRNATGVVNDLWTSNNIYVSVQPTLFALTGVPPLQVEVEGFAEDETALTMKFKAETASLNGSSTQRILLFNFTTNVYDLVDTRASPGTDGVTEITVSGNPSRYIHPTDLNVKALLQYSPGVFSSSNWTVKFDQTIWTITR